MKIAMLAPFEESVPPVKYGGTELVVYNLTMELSKLGHEVTLISAGTSKVASKSYKIFSNPLRNAVAAEALETMKYMGVARTVSYLLQKKFDIIHNHIGWRFLPFSKLLKIPTLTTLHGPLSAPRTREIFKLCCDYNYVSISMSQQNPMPDLNYVGNVYNGIDVDAFKFFEKTEDYYAFLGRMSPEKGPAEAIKIVKKAGVKLIMAAKVDITDKDYFESEVKPYIDGKQIIYIGEVDHVGKVELLGNAKGLIAPIQWDEPFGLYFVEAMACGTPVLSIDRGSVPELIIDGKTGFVCKNETEIVKKISQIEKLNRKDSWDHVRMNFSARKMAEDYLAIYNQL